MAPRPTDSACASLAKDAAVLTARAEFLYSRGDTVAAYKQCQSIMRHDPRTLECMDVLLACMVQLAKKNELFQLGHRCVPPNMLCPPSVRQIPAVWHYQS